MKVLFSNPPWWEGQEGNLSHRGPCQVALAVYHTYRFPTRQLSAGRLYALSFLHGLRGDLPSEGCRRKRPFPHSIALRESYESYFRHLVDENYDYIFLETATPSWEHDRQIIARIHQNHPHCKLVIAGPITTTRGRELLSDYPIHACILGEYEKGSVRVLAGESGLINFDLLTVAEMNAAPFPYFDLLHAYRYWDCNPCGQLMPHASNLEQSRLPLQVHLLRVARHHDRQRSGWHQGATVRHYTPDYMEAFIREIVARYHFKSIYFDDDTFNLGNGHVVGMCEVMRRIGVPWSAMCRADTSKMETWKLMKDCGCFGVKIGFESGNQHVVDKIVNKHLDLEYAKQVVHELKRIGMTVHGTFTFGLPGETREQMEDTIRFIQSLPFDSYQTSGTAEIEGTPLHTLRVKGGKLSKYEAATVDANYSVEHDGNKKWERVIDRLRYQ